MIAMFRRARRTTSTNSNRSTLLLSLALALSLVGSAAMATVSESSGGREFAPLPDEVGAILSAQPAGPAIPNPDPLEQVELRSPTTELVPEAAITCNGAGGLWSAPGSWTGGVPTAADSVTITSGCTITIDTAAVALSAVVESGGILEWDAAVARTLTVGQSVVVDAGGIFRTPASGTITAHVLSLGTSLTNNGTLDFSTNTNTAGAGITFTGAGNATFDGSGTTTNIRTLTINKGTAISNILELSTSNFSVQGTTTDGTPMAFLTLTNGTFKVSGSFTAAGRVFTAAAYAIPATAGFWLNNPNFTVSGQTGSPTNNGLLRLSNGVFNVGTASGNSMGGGTGSFFTIEGGTLNVTGRLNSSSTNITYRQSGGVVNVSTVGNAASTTPSFGFTGGGTLMFFSGGSINLVQASTGGTPVDYNQLGTMVFTGGTLNVGTAATATNFIFRVQGQMPAVVIDNTTNNKTANLSGQGNVWGNLTLNTGTTLNLNPGTGQTLLMIGPAIVNNGAIVVNTNNTGSVNFAGGLQQAVPAYAQSYSGSGTYGTAALRIASVALQNPLGVTLNPAVPMLNTYRVNGFYGPLTGADRLALGNTDAVAVVIQRGATGVPFASGSLDVAPNYSIGAGGLILVYAQSAAAVTTGPEVPGSRSVLSVQISNPTGVTVAGGSLTCTGATTCLVLGGGTLTTDSTNLFIVANTAAASLSGGSALTYVNGPLARTLPASLAAAATYTFPVGKSSFKMFELVNPTTNAGGTVVVQTEVFDANSGGTAGTGFSALNSNRYWSAAITAGGANFTNATVRLTEQGTVASNAIGQSATQAGAYDSIAGAVAPPVIGPSSAVTALGFFAVGTLTGSGAMCGNFDIGAATVPPNFTTLTAAVAALNSQPMTCAVTFTLLDATYPTETYPIILQPNGGASATNTLTIKPGPGVNAAFTGSSASALIVLNGADWVTIDGSNTVGGTTRNVSLQNTNATLASAVIWGQSIGTGDSTTNNTIKNLVLTGNGPAVTFAGVGFGSSTISTATVGLKNINNRIENNLIQSVQNGIVSFGASSIVKNTGTVITGNTIGGAGALATGRTGIVVGFDDGTQVTNNSIVNVNGAVGSSDAIGIALGTLAMSNTGFTVTDVANVLVTGNIIGAVTKTDTFSAAGICLATTNYGTSRIANNSVFGVRANGTSGDFGVGIYIGNAGSAYSPTQVYYNSVSMDGNRDTGGASTQPSFALAIVGANPMVDLRNNALYNFSTAASAASGSYAIGISSTPPLTNFTSNFNDFFTSGASSRFAMSGSLVSVLSDRPTLAAWQAATGTDANSIAVDPMFNSPTILAPQPDSPLLGAGTPVAVTVDILGVARSVSTPTIGAYEQAADLSGPAIAYTAFANTTSTANRILAITATDFTGVPTAGIGLPVVYFRKGAGIYQASQCTFVSGSSYNCTLDYSLVGGVVTGDTIQYYVVAQDTLGNVSVNPAAGAAGFSTNPPAAATPPTVPNSYLISPAIGGTRSVCASGCDFTTLTGAGGLFSAINASVATSNLVVEIGSDLVVGEDGSVALNQLAEEPAGSNFTLKIYPIGAPRLITSTTAPTAGFIRLNGADRVTIDGSIGGTGTDRSLTITDTNTGIASAVVWLQSNGADGATNNVIKNLNIVGTTVTVTPATLIGIGSGSSAVSVTSFGTGNNNNTFQNNDIRKTVLGIYSGGASAANKNTGTVITQNVMNAASPNNVTTGGILVNFENGVQVTQNDIGNLLKHDGTVGTSGTVFGIALGLVPSNTVTVFTGSDVTNAIVTRNKIDALTQLNGTGFSSFGIVVNSVTSGTTLVANNMISQVRSPATASDFSAGIVAGGGTGSTTQIYANSVSMTGARGAAAAFPSYGLAINSGNPLVDVRDNIFTNLQTTAGTGKMYAIAAASTSFTNMTTHHNDLFTTVAANYFAGQTGGLGIAGTDRITLADWQTATGLETPGSLAVDPLFVSDSDLHLQITSPMVNAGVALGAVTVDFDNDPRPVTTPDIGADEIVSGILAFSSATYVDGEAAGTTTITVNRTGGSSGIVSIDYGTAGVNAVGGGACTAGVDYISTSGTLTFVDSDVSESFTVTLCPDSLSEANETLNVNLGNPLGGAIMGTPNTAVLTITDDDPAPTISITDVTQNELNSGTSLFTFGVSLSAASGQNVTVHYQTADGSATTADTDYAPISDTILTFLPGETLKNVDVTVNGDPTPEPTENFFVNLSTATNASILDNQGIGTITNDDVVVTGPVTVTATAGTPGPTDYATLKLAFDAINAGTHQGVITIDLVTTTTDTVPAVLNSSGAGAASYTSVFIRPTNDGLSLSATTATGRGVIELNGADNVTIDGDNPNTAGTNRDLTIFNSATNTTTFTSVVRVALSTLVSSANSVIVRNSNILGSATGRNVGAATSTSGSENTTYGILVGGGASTVAATTAPSAIASVTTVIGTGITATGFTAHNNSIDACARGIAVQGSAITVAPNLTVTNNVIGNATPGNTTTVYSRGMTLQGFNPATVTGNTIRNIESFIGTSIAGLSLGDVNAAGTNATVAANNISGVFARSTTTFGAYGINVSAGNSMAVSNNFISGIRHDMTGGAAFSTQFGVFGIRLQSGSNHTVYYNSVNLFGLYPGTANTQLLSAALEVVATTQTGLDIRNNILSNNITGGSTSIAHVAIYLPAGGTSAMNLNLNNNAYFYGTDAARQGVGQAGTTPATNFFTTFAALKAYTSTLSAGGTNDNASFASTSAAPFTSSTDLHIPAATATQLESSATPVAVTVDIDGAARSVTTPDIGADEFAGVFVDLTPPDITYVPLVGTSLTTSRTLSISVTDNSGVPTAGIGRPVIYFRKGAVDPYVSSTCNFVSGSSYSCLIDYSLVTGGSVTVGDQVQYYVAAQDNVNNVAVNPAAGAAGLTANPPAAATPPSPARSYSIVTAVAGTLTVGTGGTFASLTNTGGVFEFVNANALTANVTIDILSDLAAELGTVGLNQWAEDGAGGYTMLIRPSGGAARLILGNNATALIRLNGADRVTFDGLNTGGNTLTIRNVSTAGATLNLLNDASNNSVLNCTIEGSETGAGSGVIFLGAGTVTGNDSNTFSNNIIRDRTDAAGIPANLFVSLNASLSATNSSNVISNNVLRNFTANGFAASAIISADNWTITNNEFVQDASRVTAVIALNMGGAGGTNTVSGNTIHGLATNGANAAVGMLFGGGNIINVSKNRIFDFPGVAGATGVIVGIQSNGVSGGTPNLTVTNNFISIVPTVSTNQSIKGINDFGFGGNIFTAAYNTVYIGGTASGTNATWALMRGNAAPTTFTSRNNLAFNNRTGGGANHFAGADQSANTGTFDSNFNFFAGTGATAANFMDYGTVATGTAVSYAAWQTGPPARDANSIGNTAGTYVVTDFFVNQDAGDLHLKFTATPVINAGTPFVGVTVDIDNDARSVTAPEIGADELGAQADLSITKTDGVTSVTPGGSTTYTITASNAGPSNVTGATVADTIPAFLTCNWTCSGAAGGTCAASGSGNINDTTVNLPMGGSVTYILSCTVSGGASGSIANTATVSSATADPNGANNSATDTDTVGAPSADLSITKTDGSATEIPGTTVAYTIVASNAGPSPAPSATVADSFTGVLSACSTTCVGSGGGTCTAGPVAGNLNDTAVVLPVGGSVTYTATCTISSTATGSLANTATVSSATADPNAGNNSATDTDTLNPSANVGITKTDGSTTATAGQPVVYTIVASNAGPSAAPTVTVADTFVASLTGCSTTVAYGGGASGAAGPFAGNLSTNANLPVGGTATYTATCTLSPSASGTLVNTATATVGGGVTDPTPGNNTATDTDTVLTSIIFIDGFVSGNTSAWSLTVPFNFSGYAEFAVAPGASEVGFDYDLSAVEAGQALEQNPIAILTNAAGEALVSIMARRTAASEQLELSLEIAGAGRSSWIAVAEVAQQVRIEWSAADQGSLGHVAVYLDGRLVLWVDGFASTVTPASVQLLRAPVVTSPVEP